jgi:Gpi18-like mannosyltransferase
MQSPTAIEIAWWKTLLALFYIGSAIVIHKIAGLIESPYKTKSSLVSTLFATSPFVIFSVFIFSGYDVISVFFTLLGFYYYLKKDIKRFIFFFAIAISCKYFATILFFPLILMIEKRPIHITKYLILGSLAVALGLCFYWRSEIFRQEIFNLMLLKIKGNPLQHINLSERLNLAISLFRFSFAMLMHYLINERKTYIHSS